MVFQRNQTFSATPPTRTDIEGDTHHRILTLYTPSPPGWLNTHSHPIYESKQDTLTSSIVKTDDGEAAKREMCPFNRVTPELTAQLVSITDGMMSELYAMVVRKSPHAALQVGTSHSASLSPQLSASSTQNAPPSQLPNHLSFMHPTIQSTPDSPSHAAPPWSVCAY